MLGQPSLCWLVLFAFDISLYAGSVAISFLVVIPGLHQLTTSGKFPLWAFFFFIIFIDASHVYATIYRVYLDKKELLRRKALYFGVFPVLYFLALGFYIIHPKLFWCCLAYYATFHFIKQIEGYVMLYRIKGNDYSKNGKLIDKGMVYCGVLFPVLYWHDHLPRAFDWFLQGDYAFFYNVWPVFIKENLKDLIYYGWFVVAAYSLFYIIYQLRCFGLKKESPWGKWMIMFLTWLTWYVGIILYNDDIIFSSLIVVFHGIPYMGLIWLYCHNKWHDEKGASSNRFLKFLTNPKCILLFVLLLILLSFAEELVWDWFIWGDYLPSTIVRGRDYKEYSKTLLPTLMVPLLSLPQMIHYYLDRKIWKFDGSNPDLAYYLRFKDEIITPENNEVIHDN